MKYTSILLLSLFTFSAFGQISFNTGSVQLDSDLNSINANAKLNFGSFKANLSLSYNVSEKKIDYMKASLHMTPGEIYFALEVSKLSRTPIDEVNQIYINNKSKGWGYIAKQAGIKPGSSEFQQLKRNANGNKSKGNKGKENSNGKGKSKGKGKG